MPAITTLEFGILALVAVVAAILSWNLRGARSKREKRAVNAGWQQQIDAQQSETDRLQNQNKSLMQQINQYQASIKDARGRAQELVASLRTATDKRDALQREAKELRGKLRRATTQEEALRKDLAALDERCQAAARTLRGKDERIEWLKRELSNWHSRVPPLVERFRTRNQEAEALAAELAAMRGRVEQLDRRAAADATRIEPMDGAAADLDASNDQYEETSHHDMSSFDEQPRPGAYDGYAGGYAHLPGSGPRHDLKRIKGIGPAIEKTLHELGYHRFDQIANLNEFDISRIAERLRGFSGRIQREDWIGQARMLQYDDGN